VNVAKLAHLELGKSTIDDVLAIAGAPSEVAWVETQDVLVYESARVRTTHWTLDNPITFVGRVTPQGFAGELVSAVIFTAGGTNRILPTQSVPRRPTPPSTPDIMGGFSKPLKLDGNNRGDDEVRFHFDGGAHTLCQIEWIYAQPRSGSGAIAENTFLR
jgi:hypothetical protein